MLGFRFHLRVGDMQDAVSVKVKAMPLPALRLESRIGSFSWLQSVVGGPPPHRHDK